MHKNGCTLGSKRSCCRGTDPVGVVRARYANDLILKARINHTFSLQRWDARNVAAAVCADRRLLDEARQIVLEHGWNATSYQILNPGISLWFSVDRRAVVGYTRKGDVLLVAGAPVCDPAALKRVCDEFESFAGRFSCRVCYVCAEERLRAHFAASSRHTAVALGAQPAWDPATWPQITGQHGSLRAQLHRARNKGVVVETIGSREAAACPGMRSVLIEWLEGRRLPPLHFLVEPNVLEGVLTDRVVMAARRQDSVVAFLVASPVRARKGYLVELLARSHDAPNGTSELLIDAAMRHFADQSCGYVTLGLVALAHAAEGEIGANPRWLRALMHFARAHANRFYNFRGLEHFRVKMLPNRWDTIYAISDEQSFSAQTLYAIGAAFSGMPPPAAIALGISKAAVDEVRTACRFLMRR